MHHATKVALKASNENGVGESNNGILARWIGDFDNRAVAYLCTMICPTCKGERKQRVQVPINNGGTAYLDAPCDDCGGTGIAHCCDGLQEQPNADQNGSR